MYHLEGIKICRFLSFTGRAYHDPRKSSDQRSEVTLDTCLSAIAQNPWARKKGALVESAYRVESAEVLDI